MKKYDIAAYIWPAYHYEPRMEQYWPEKDGEWYIVRRATPRFPDHYMPRVPTLGYQDEASPEVMRQHIELGAKYGVNTFIMDWYWYDNAPCFERQLNDGLMPAIKGTDSKFFLMWANHDADTLWDMHTDDRELIWDGKVNREEFESMMERVIDNYFTHENYYCIDSKPVFSIHMLSNFVAGLGGVDAARAAIDWLRNRVKQKGFPGIHIMCTIRRGNAYSPEAGAKLESISYEELVPILGLDSGTSYQFASDAGFQEGEYSLWAEEAVKKWYVDEQLYPMRFPHVSVGWDNTQRNPSIKTAVVNSTPYAFEACLRQAKEYVDTHPDQPPLISINSWNEWTEGSYLLPDEKWGYSFLEAVKNVFTDEEDDTTKSHKAR